MSAYMAIRKSALPSLPENAQKYVAEYFREGTVLGVECLVAQRHIFHPSSSSYSRWGNGMAPSHSVELARFGKDDVGRDVGSVLRDACRERPDDFIEVYVTERSHPSSVYDD